MEKFSIPQEHIEKIELYISLPDNVKSILINIVRNSEIGIMPNTLVKNIEEQIDISHEDIKNIVSLIFNFIGTKEKSKLNFEDFEVTLSESLKNNITKYDVNDIANQITNLIKEVGNKPLVTMTSLDLVTENQNIFLDATVNTDIRPILIEEEQLNYAVLVHNFKIVYRLNEEEKYFFVSLDNNDIEKLKKQIEKAESNFKRIKETINIDLIEFK